ncbi:MAG: tetratricopeptide repeat protein [Sedimentisphaerales bacterium]|nr:tetratricopeptide repeat protein [Sedimentisphaerales bacterium]
MKSTECTQCRKLYSIKVKECPFCCTPNIHHKSNMPKKWHQKTSVNLYIAGILLIIALGFIHIIIGGRTRTGLPMDIGFKKSFGFKETVVDIHKIKSMPYVTAKIKYPKSCEVLQRLGYIGSGEVFETAMKDTLLLKFKDWQNEFEQSIGSTEINWQDKLLGWTDEVNRISRDAGYYNNRGITAAKQSQFEDAISEFTRAINRDPTFSDAYYNRGLVYNTLGHQKNAMSDFTKVIEISPQSTEGYFNRGQIYLAKNEYEQTIADFTKVIEIDPEHVQSYFGRLLVYFALGDYDKTWDDVHHIETLGYTIPSEFLSALRQFSNRRN